MKRTKASGKRAIVTGASSGIGEAFAYRLARDGFAVTVVARRKDRLSSVVERIKQEHRVDAEMLVADLADARSLRKVEAYVAECEELELLVNNAGFGTATKFAESDIDRVEHEITLNVIALVRLTRAALPGLLKRDRGAVINVSSSAGFQPNPFLASYGATKAYVNSFTEAVSDELRGTEVRMLAVCPGPVRTEFGAVAGVDESKAPAFAYISAEEVVEDSLAALARGQDVVVPGTLPRAMMAATGLLPHRLQRRISFEVGRRFFE